MTMLQPRSLFPSTVCRSCLTYISTRSASRQSVGTKPVDGVKRAHERVQLSPDGPRPVAVTKDAATIQPDNASQATKPKAGAHMMRTYKPRTPGIRHLRRPINDHLWKGRPFLALTFPKKGQGLGGRNRLGRVTVRHRGGGHKRRIRIVDFQRSVPGKHTVERIEHDPNRSAHIALLTNDMTGEKSYIVAAEGMREGDVLESYMSGLPDELIQSMGGTLDPGMLATKTALRGNCLPIRMVPMGTQVYCLGSQKGKGAVFCRSAGTYAIVVSKEETRRKTKEVVVRLQSGEVRRVDPDACATVGVASNPHFHFRQLGKAGRKRWLGIRPTVRGVAMNAKDHPHGGGRGKSKGNVIPVSPWGTPAKSGYKTRYKRNPNKFMVHDRPRNQGKRRSKA